MSAYLKDTVEKWESVTRELGDDSKEIGEGWRKGEQMDRKVWVR